jgi:hypothetical protein
MLFFVCVCVFFTDVGDPVIVKMKFDDGWGYGFNMTTKMEGSFPLACVAPFDREGGAARTFLSHIQTHTCNPQT